MSSSIAISSSTSLRSRRPHKASGVSPRNWEQKNIEPAKRATDPAEFCRPAWRAQIICGLNTPGLRSAALNHSGLNSAAAAPRLIESTTPLLLLGSYSLVTVDVASVVGAAIASASNASTSTATPPSPSTLTGNSSVTSRCKRTGTL